jgi:hypothetical protein
MPFCRIHSCNDLSGGSIWAPDGGMAWGPRHGPRSECTRLDSAHYFIVEGPSTPWQLRAESTALQNAQCNH